VDKVAITIKGIKDGILVSVGEGSWETAVATLLQTIEQQQGFFRGAQIALYVGDRSLDHDEIRKLRDKMAEHDVRLSTILGTSSDTIRAARRNQLETSLPESPRSGPEEDLPPIDSNEYGNTGVLVKNTVRSGRVVRHVGHVVILGDVNPGAQVIAGGDVIVWGRLRGTVHAGATGDTSAVVCALDMRPQQLRIANHVAIGATDNAPRGHPETAYVVNGQIVAKEWGS